MPEDVEADLSPLCNEHGNDSLEQRLQRAEPETELEPSQVGELRALISEFSSSFTDKP